MQPLASGTRLTSSALSWPPFSRLPVLGDIPRHAVPAARAAREGAHLGRGRVKVPVEPRLLVQGHGPQHGHDDLRLGQDGPSTIVGRAWRALRGDRLTRCCCHPLTHRARHCTTSTRTARASRATSSRSARDRHSRTVSSTRCGPFPLLPYRLGHPPPSAPLPPPSARVLFTRSAAFPSSPSQAAAFPSRTDVPS